MSDRAPESPRSRGSPQDLEPLSAFSLSLIKAMMQAGFYEPGHPEAEKALATLYDDFRAALEARSEITYMVAGSGSDDRTVMIQGYQTEALTLEDVMTAGMAEIFVAKFIEFFDRRNLLSFSLKGDLAPQEFAGFVGLMSQPPSGQLTPEEERDRLTHEFVGQHILHISTVFNDDVVGKDRELPWWVEVSLSRLSRDLRVLPLYEHASPEDIQRIKVQILDDVIRPVHTPELLKDFLINCDLVTEVIDLEEAELERVIVDRIAVDRLSPTAQAIVKQIEQLGDVHGDEAAAATDRCLDVLREVIDRLRREGHEIDYDLLESLVARGLVPPEELPRQLQDTLATRSLAETFMTHPDKHIEALECLGAGSDDGQLVDLVARVFPDIVRRGECATAAKILQALGNRTGVGTSGDLETRLRSSIADEAMVAKLITSLELEEKEERQHLVDILAFIGDPAGPGLLQAYAATSSKSVRSSAFEAIRQIGAGTIETFLERLPEIEEDWSGIRHIVVALADDGDPALAKPISAFARHENLHVREATLSTLMKLQGSGAETHFLRALNDQEPAVRAMAVACLGQSKSTHRAAWDFYAAAFGGADNPPEGDAVLVKVCQALAGFEDGPTEDSRRAETLLLTALRPAEQTGVLWRFKKITPRFSQPVQEAICGVLAAVGSLDAVDPLRRLADTADASVSERATSTVDLIERGRTAA